MKEEEEEEVEEEEAGKEVAAIVPTPSLHTTLATCVHNKCNYGHMDIESRARLRMECLQQGMGYPMNTCEVNATHNYYNDLTPY